MFAIKSPMLFTCLPTRRRNPRCVRAQYKIDNTKCQPIEQVEDTRIFHILAFIRDGDTGIYSVKEYDEDGVSHDSIVAFRNFEDALRYKTLLEAEMDMTPFVQLASMYDIEYLCFTGNYNCLVMNEGVLVTPPIKTLEVTDWERRSALLGGRWSVRDKH
jgi:hypothetical protein